MVTYDVVVLGAGFYGAKIAIELKSLGVGKVAIIEPNPIGSQATTANQNRIHGGYHYPRSLVTAASARKNYLRFLADHAATINGNNRHLYAIGEGSLTSPKEFERVCDEIGAPYKPVLESLFSNLVQAAYEVDEVAFDIHAMRHLLYTQLQQARVERITARGKIVSADDNGVELGIQFRDGSTQGIRAAYVFNCTYGQIDQVGTPIRTKLKKEWTEVALVEPVPELWETDITVMDGPFWSLMAYPSKCIHALTHVRYTPHSEWFPPNDIPQSIWGSQASLMIEDATRYVPLMRHTQYRESLVTTRVVLADNENDDGRPVLWEYSPFSARIISVLGSKFNSIYDALDKLRSGEWRQTSHTPSLRVAGRRALIGRGFVGSSLMGEARFTHFYNESNIDTMQGHYHQIVIAAPRGLKWWANLHPEDDREQVAHLTRVLKRVTAEDVVLLSTIDTFSVYGGEYGRNRAMLEDNVTTMFPAARIVRLPALYGSKMKKNALYDLLHPRMESDLINRMYPDDTYQWYNIERLWEDLKKVLPGETVDFLPAPIPMEWIAEQLGQRIVVTSGAVAPVNYNYGPYTETEEDVKAGLRKFIEENRR